MKKVIRTCWIRYHVIRVIQSKMRLARTYSTLMTFDTFGDRLEYLKLHDDYHIPPHNNFYKSRIWLQTRDMIIKRDLGQDLGVMGQEIEGPIIIHHIDPLEIGDLEDWNDKLLNPENLICTSIDTHNAIHYSEKINYIERSPGDTNLW